MLTMATGLLLPGASRARCVFMVKVALLAAAAGLLICACASAGPAPITGIGPAPSPSRGPRFGFDAMVTENDEAITIQVGEKLEAALPEKPGTTNRGSVVSDR